MTVETLPDIPRLFTALAEWSACLVYILLIGRRLRWATFVPTMLGGLGVISGVQWVAGLLPLEFWVVGMAMAAGSMYLLILAAGDVTLREGGDLLARAFVLAELTASLEWQLDVFFFGSDAQAWDRVGLLIGSYAVVFGAAYWAERKHFPRDHRVPIDPQGLVGVGTVALATFVVSNLSFLTTATPFSGRLGHEIFYIRTLVDLCGFVVLFALRGQRLTLMRAAEADAASMMLRHQRERYLQSKHDIDTVNRKYHDLKHYIHAIRAEGDPRRRAAFVDQLEDSIRGYEVSMLETGSHVLDTVLTSKRQQCDRAGITLTCVADGTAVASMDPMDLVTIVGNALDNAIEATSKVADPEKRLIRVAIYRQDRLAMILVENYFEGQVAFRHGVPLTTKRNSLEHGYGVRNMRDTAQRNGGSLTAQASDGWFRVRALIPVTSDTP